jgi:hypothetical protein
VSRNVVELSLGPGMVIDGAADLIERNQISTSGGDGLTVTGADHTVTRNVLKLNAGDGLALEAPAGMVVSRNQTDRNGGFGILETPALTPGSPNDYPLNICGADALGDSLPAGLCQ